MLKIKDDFGNIHLNKDYVSLDRILTQDWINTTERAGYLRIYGGNLSVESSVRNALFRGINSKHHSTSTQFEFEPKSDKQKAGLIAYYNVEKWFSFYLTSDALQHKKHIQVCYFNNKDLHQLDKAEINPSQSVELKISVENRKILFYYSTKKHQWHKFGPSLSTALSNQKDGRVVPTKNLSKENKVYVGLFVEDGSKDGCFADFDYLKFEAHQ